MQIETCEDTPHKYYGKMWEYVHETWTHSNQDENQLFSLNRKAWFRIKPPKPVISMANDLGSVRPVYSTLYVFIFLKCFSPSLVHFMQAVAVKTVEILYQYAVPNWRSKPHWHNLNRRCPATTSLTNQHRPPPSMTRATNPATATGRRIFCGDGLASASHLQNRNCPHGRRTCTLDSSKIGEWAL